MENNGDRMVALDHLMLDIETIGSNVNAPIVSIAAVQFDLDGGIIGQHFYGHLDVDEQIKTYGRVPDWSTIKFWLEQSDDARKKLINPVAWSFANFNESFSQWIKFWFKKPYEMKVWGNGAKFDLGIYTALTEAAGLELPWRHSNERDVRTIVDFDPDLKKSMEFIGTKHDPIDDCKHQIRYISDIKAGINYNRYQKLIYSYQPMEYSSEYKVPEGHVISGKSLIPDL